MNTVGVDIQLIHEVEMSVEEFGMRYLRRLFTNREIKCCRGKKPVIAACCYAERFAAKEAVLKILDVRDMIPSWKDIEVLGDIKGSLKVYLSGTAAELSRNGDIRRILLTVSHSDAFAVAVATALR
jgi:holo-[acyl-carrier protein] synthase